MKKKINNLYYKCPIILQNIAFSCYGYLNDSRRYGRHYREIYKEVINRQKKSINDLKFFQKNKLSSFLQHSQKSPFWAKKFQKYKVDLSGDPYVEIKKLPVLTKNEVRKNADEILIDYGQKILKGHTSGSTGAGLILYEDLYSEAFRWATCWRYREKFGVNRHTWCGLFGGRTILKRNKQPYHRINLSSKQVSFSCYHLNETTIQYYISAIEKFKLKWLHGYPSFLNEVARLALKKNLHLGHEIKLITVCSENLMENQVANIYDFFGVRPKQHYNMSESVACFSQSEDSENLIVDEDYSYVEFIKNTHESKKIIGTNFTNLTFPLIRYDTGDLATLEDESSFPRKIKSVDGRQEDAIILPTGEVIGRLDHIFKDAVYADAAQIFQKSDYSLNVKIIPNQQWNMSKKEQLIGEFRERLGVEIPITITTCKKLPLTDAGKMRFVVSELWQDNDKGLSSI